MTDYYVSPTGRNQNNGTSPSTPWRGIQKGLNSLSAGDTLFLMEGTYDPGREGIDSWTVSGKKGTASKKITIKNYNSGVVKLSGLEAGADKGYPQAGLKVFDGSRGSYTYKGITYKLTYAALFDIKNSSHVSVEGLRVCDSLGEAYNITDSDNIVMRNCQLFNIRSRAMTFRDSTFITFENNECDFCNWGKMSGSGGPNAHNCEYIFLDNNIFSQLDGEGMVFDAECKNIYIRNNLFFDITRGAIYISGADYVVITGNFIYPTVEDLAAGPGSGKGSGGFNSGGGGKAISVNARECDFATHQKGSKYVLVAHNVIYTMSVGVQVKTEPGTAGNCIPDYERQPMKYIYIVNNTVFRSTQYNFRFNTDTFENCVFKNNISVNDHPDRHVNSGEGNVTGVNSDYNLYSSAVNIPSNLRGSHDIVNKDPELENPVSMHKSKPVKQEDAAGWYVSFGPLIDSTVNARGLRITSGSPAKDAGTTITAPSGWNSDPYDTSMADYVDWSYDFNWPHTEPNPLRGSSGTWDIGGHEYQVEQITIADFTASPTSGKSPLVVSFRDQSTSSSPITSRFWDFGDGIVSTERNPDHEYRQGDYSVSLRVTSSAGSDINTKDNFIKVTAPETPKKSRVTDGLKVLYRFDEGAGDTIYDVSGVGLPLDLKISNPNAVNWLSQGLEIRRSTVIVSNGPASKINEACRDSREMSLEVWLKPRTKKEDGPARIVSISKNMHSRNITLGQGLWGTQPSDLYDVRLRTTERSANGMPSFSSAEGTVELQKTHIVFTRTRGGRARYYINGFVAAETNISGDFSTWNPRFPLLLGNETTGEYPWRGEVYLVAIYERALRVIEVKQNFHAGTQVAPSEAQSSAVPTAAFKRFTLVKNGSGANSVQVVGKTVAYGVQYPDMRCVICADGNANSMAVYPDVNAIIRAYGKQGIKISWLD